MHNLVCHVQDPDKFSNGLLVEFINKTSGISLSNNDENDFDGVDVIFMDADFSEINTPIHINRTSQVVVVSSDTRHIHSLFKDQIAGYLFKSSLTYSGFLNTIEKVRSKREV